MSKTDPVGRTRSGLLGKLAAAQENKYAKDLKRAIAQEQHARAKLDRLRHTFLSTVNHEMRTPLVLILQSIELLESNRLGTMTPDQLDTMMVLKRQSRQLDRMILSLTRVAGFLSKQENIKPVMGRLSPVFKSVLPLAEFKARSKQIAIKTDIPATLPPFPLDVKQVEEVMTQLLDNAIKFNRSGGQINITAGAAEAWIIISVSDTGPGIEPERIKSIWEVFEQNSDPVRRAQEGLGLGLVLVRYIVDAHRGLVEIETEPGKGSTFTVKLPRTREIKKIDGEDTQ